MPRYSQTSIDRLNTCCEELQQTMRRVIQFYDHTILEGRRGEDAQNHYFKTGKSKLRYPKSKHNGTPSLAVDAVSWPLDWDDWKAHYHFGGIVVATGFSLGHRIRWGGNWDMWDNWGTGRTDNDFHDQKFMDLVHFEYAGPIQQTTVRKYGYPDGLALDKA